MHHLPHIVAMFNNAPYVGIPLALLFSGYGLPIPEEIILLGAGYLGSTEAVNAFWIGAVSFVAIAVSDILLFWLARSDAAPVKYLQVKVEQSRFFNNGILSKAHVGRTIFLSRFIVGLRFFGPVFAGMVKAPWRVFLIYHIFAMSIYVPFFVFLGYHSHHSFLRIVTQVEFIRHVLFTAFLVLVGALIVHYTRKREHEDETATEASS